jgi:hypothetical protein
MSQSNRSEPDRLPQVRHGSSGTAWLPQDRATGPCAAVGPARSPPARRTTARPAGSGRRRGVVADSVGTYHRRARSECGCSVRASAGDRVVATLGGLAWLVPPPSSRARDRRLRGQCRAVAQYRPDPASPRTEACGRPRNRFSAFVPCRHRAPSPRQFLRLGVPSANWSRAKPTMCSCRTQWPTSPWCRTS